MTCRDCFHHEVCSDFRRNICEIDQRRFEEYKINSDGLCGDFKNKACFVELPCKVGDTVYRISKRYGKWEILPRMVSSMTYALDHFYRVVWCIHTTADDYLGKTVFLTREEAEAATKKRSKA